jgi:DNA polymerase-3 subunit gamma/tau
MSYEVLARKWRPQQFDDVVGQEHVTTTLRNAIALDRVAHAYLFVGPRGTGKTTSARIFAKALNCENGASGSPCDACDACREIMQGNNLDVLEIDGASNNGVEQVRDLRQNVQYSPTRGPYKIYIIDEVHMLSIAAFNALLKTLEEPPRHVKFVFATTEPQKVPATILSRCQRFDLKRIPVRTIVGRLDEIAEAEGVQVEEAAMLAIARGAEGGMRDAQSALDQLIAFRGTDITEADVLSVFGLVSWTALEGLMTAILTGDIPAAMAQVAALDQEGKDLQRLVVELLEHFRNLLIFSYGGGDTDALDLTDAQLEAVKRHGEDLEASRVLRIVDILTDVEDRMRTAMSRRTLLETGLIRSARAATVVSIDELIRAVDALRGSAPDAVASSPAKPAEDAPETPKQGLVVQGGSPAADPPAAVENGIGNPGSEPKQKRTKADWIREPAVQKTLEMFNGRIEEIRDS